MPIFSLMDEVILITGKATPEFAPLAWKQFIDDLKEHIKGKRRLILNFKLDLYNSSSSRFITEMLNILDQNYTKCKSIVNWFYFPNDDTTFEDGEMYAETFKNIEFNFKIRHE